MTDVAAPAPVYAARSAQPAAARETVLATWRGNLGDATRMAAKFDWFYRDCPWGEPLLQLLAHVPSGTDIGVAAAGPRRMLRDGVAIEAGVLVDLAVLPEHRSLGPALMLQQSLIDAADSRFELLYGFPNPKAAPVFKRVGYVHLADCVRHARVVRHARYLERRMPRAIARIVAPFVDATVALRDRARAWRDAPLTASWHETAGADVDALWQRARPASGIAAVRDREFLAWRFERGPLPAVRYLMLHGRDGALAAWFACTREDDMLHVRDFWSTAALAGMERAGVDTLLRAARRAGAHAVSVEIAGTPARIAGWLAAGFAERGRRPVFGRWRGGAAADAASLHLTSADEDE